MCISLESIGNYFVDKNDTQLQKTFLKLKASGHVSQRQLYQKVECNKGAGSQKDPCLTVIILVYFVTTLFTLISIRLRNEFKVYGAFNPIFEKIPLWKKSEWLFLSFTKGYYKSIKTPYNAIIIAGRSIKNCPVSLGLRLGYLNYTLVGALRMTRPLITPSSCRHLRMVRWNYRVCKVLRGHISRDDGLEIVWSEFTFVWDGLTRGTFKRTLVWSEKTLSAVELDQNRNQEVTRNIIFNVCAIKFNQFKRHQ